MITTHDNFDPHDRRRRALQALLLVALVLLLVVGAFFRTQVLHGSRYALRSDENRLRVIPIPAPRGTVFDRDGRVVAETVVRYALLLRPQPADSARALLARLAPTLPLDSLRVRVLAERADGAAEPVPVQRTLSFEQAAWIEERRGALSGLVLQPRPERHYPDGEAVAHLVGYTAQVGEHELADPRWADYASGRIIGKSGLERQYETLLGGHPGERYVEVDARGRMVGSLVPEATRPPRRGGDLTLTLDLGLQRFVHERFPADHAGAVVALRPGTGEVLALYSAPTFDPNLLTGGAPAALWAEWMRDERAPLLNRAVAGTYSPGSTWKLATALIALEEALIGPESTMPMPCTGGLSYAGRYSRCWKTEGHGALDLVDAIAHSCNVYFYQLGIWLGLNRMTREGTRLGFGRPTGIDLPGERAGTWPRDASWYRTRFAADPQPSEVLDLAIGQGANAQTPLRMAQLFAALAGDGTAPAPRLRAAPVGRGAPPEVDLRVGPEALRAVREGMRRVLEPDGTAHAAALQPWTLAGKTGTSQNSQDPARPHVWFAGLAGPRDGEPTLALAVVVESGDSGSATAAPLAAEIAEFWLEKREE